jgi:peroxiredoxin
MVSGIMKLLSGYKRTSVLHTSLMLLISFGILSISLCCTQGRKPETTTPKDPETIAADAFRALEIEYNSREEELHKSIRLGEAVPDEINALDEEFRRRQEEFVKEYWGTQAAAGVMLGFATQDVEQGQFASAEKRFDEIISSLKSGDNLALALVQKANLESDRDLQKALELAKQAEKVKDINIETVFEARLQRLKLLEWLGLDSRFDALYLQLSNEDSGPYTDILAFTRLRHFLRHGDMEAAKGLLDSVKGKASDDMMLILKAEYIAQNMLGKPAPPIDGVDISGVNYSLSKQKGEIVLVTFFSTGTAPILRLLPRLNRMYDEYSPKGLEMVGVCIDSKPDEINPFVARNNILWPVLHDADGKIQKSYYVIRDPKCFIINRDGTLAAHGLEGVLLEQEVRRLLGLEDTSSK